MKLIDEMLSHLTAAMQFSGKAQATMDALGARVDSVEANVREIGRDLRSHGERIARLEAAGETLEERTVLYLERAIVRATRGEGPRLSP